MTDWGPRTKALAYYEKQLKMAKRLNDEDREHLEQAVNALRRSQDHTAIQSRIKITLAQRDDLASWLNSLLAWSGDSDLPPPREMTDGARKALRDVSRAKQIASKVCVGADADGAGRQVPPSAGSNPSATEGAAPISTPAQQGAS